MEGNPKSRLYAMDLQNTLTTVANRLQSGNLTKEAHVKQAVILPVLRELNWDDTNPNEFIPEYSVNQGSVDYALLNNRNPYVFIEAKNLGCLDDKGEDQLFGYASHQGVPLLILTDGNRWDFYLSMAAGLPEERRFYRLELKHEHKYSEYVEFLENCLQKNQVISGVAKQFAERHHESNKVRATAREAIPNAWLALLKEPDERICDLLVEKVESECGTKPESDDIKDFLQKYPDTRLKPESGHSSQEMPLKPSPPQVTWEPTQNLIAGFVLREERFETSSAITTLVQIVEIFGSESPDFMQKFAKRSASKTRNLVAINRADLYQHSHLSESHAKQLRNGWWLGTNLNKSQIKGHIVTACDVAGVKFGTQLKLIGHSKK